MNPIPSTLLPAQLVQLGCLTLPMQARWLEDRIAAYDYRHSVLSVKRRFPAGRSSNLTLMGARAGWDKAIGGLKW